MLVGISRLLLRRPPPLPPPSAPLRTFFSIDPISVPSPIPLLPLDPALYTVASDAYLGGLSSGTIEKIEEDGREFIRFEGETVTRVPEVTKNTPDGNAVVRAGEERRWSSATSGKSDAGQARRGTSDKRQGKNDMRRTMRPERHAQNDLIPVAFVHAVDTVPPVFTQCACLCMGSHLVCLGRLRDLPSPPPPPLLPLLVHLLPPPWRPLAERARHNRDRLPLLTPPLFHPQPSRRLLHPARGLPRLHRGRASKRLVGDRRDSVRQPPPHEPRASEGDSAGSGQPVHRQVGDHVCGRAGWKVRNRHQRG